MKTVLMLFNIIRCTPHIIVFYNHKNKKIIIADIKRWINILNKNYNIFNGFIYLLTFYPEFRNLFYHRVGGIRHFLNIICPKMSTLFINTNEIGEGLFIQHGFATIISANSIGKNCWINQQVTIGFSNNVDCPKILDNVTIYAGAKVIGKVTLGNNSIIGANAVVVKNVPEKCTVVGVPARIVKRAY